MDRINWPAFNQAQEEFVFCKKPFVLGGGGMGSGKTNALVRRAIALSIDTPIFGNMSGNVGLIGRFKEKDFQKTTLLELKRWLPKEWIKSENRNMGIIELFNGSILHFTHFESVDHILSYNVGWCAIDQMEEIPEEVFDELAYRRVRLKVKNRYDKFGFAVTPQFDDFGHSISTDPQEIDAVLTYQTVFGVCNPKRGWLYDRFVKNEEYRLSEDPDVRRMYNADYKLVVIPTTDNQKYLPPDYIERQRRDLSPREYRRYVQGLWDAFEGQVYEDFRENTHVNHSNIVPPPGWKIVVGIDHGGSGTPQKNNATNTTAVLFLAFYQPETANVEVNVFDELYLGGSTIEETVAAIDGKLKQWAATQKMHYQNEAEQATRLKVSMWRCDPSMGRGVQDVDESVMEAYMRHARNRGFSMPLSAWPKDVMPGIYRTNWMFRGNMMHVNPKCIRLINELKSVEFDENEKIKKLQADHATDALRGAVMSIHVSVKPIEMQQQKSFVERVVEREMRDSLIQDDVYGNVQW